MIKKERKKRGDAKVRWSESFRGDEVGMEPSAAGKAPVRMAGRRSGMYKSEIDGRRNVVRKDEGKGWE